MSLKKLKELNKEDFLKLDGSNEELYEKLKNSLEGGITITKISDNNGYLQKGEEFTGYTSAFAEGLSLYINKFSSYYQTSIIQKIDWENNEFATLNSKYKFNFKQHVKNI